MSNGDGTKFWLIFIIVLLIIGIILNIIPIIGAGLFFIGIVVFLFGSSQNDNELAINGIIVAIVGVVVFFAGIVAYNFLEDIGVIDFLKLIFGKSN